MLVCGTQGSEVPALADDAEEARDDLIDQRAGAERERAASERCLDAGSIEVLGGIERGGDDRVDQFVRRSGASYAGLLNQRFERRTFEPRDLADAVPGERRSPEQAQ